MGSKVPQIFPFYVPLMWILGEVWGRGRGKGRTCSFLSTALRLLFCFAFQQVYLLDNTSLVLQKQK